MDETTLRTGRVALNVAVSSGSGPPLVLLHGVTRRWQDFLPILPPLAMRWSVLALDLRGHGRSGRTPGAYRVIDYVGDVVSLLRETIDRPAVVVGHSLGAMVAAAVAAEAPERVRAVVLEDPPFEAMGSRIEESFYPDLFRAYQALAGTDRSVEEMASALADHPLRMPNGGGTTRLGDLRDATMLRFQARCLQLLDPDVLTTAIAGRWLDGYDVDATLRRIACPALLLQGDFRLGGLLNDRDAAEIASALPRGVHIRVAGVGHMIHGMQAEATTRLLTGFLESLDD